MSSLMFFTAMVTPLPSHLERREDFQAAGSSDHAQLQCRQCTRGATRMPDAMLCCAMADTTGRNARTLPQPCVSGGAAAWGA